LIYNNSSHYRSIFRSSSCSYGCKRIGIVQKHVVCLELSLLGQFNDNFYGGGYMGVVVYGKRTLYPWIGLD